MQNTIVIDTIVLVGFIYLTQTQAYLSNIIIEQMPS